jgi:hypothetical protein
VSPAGYSMCNATSSPPCLRPCSTDSRTLSKERGERHIIHTHTHTHKHACKLSLHVSGGTCPRVVWHAQAAMLPRASSLKRVLPLPPSLVSPAGNSIWTTTSSPPCPRPCSTASPK